MLCFIRRLSLCLFACLSVDNFARKVPTTGSSLDLHENCTRDASVDNDELIQFCKLCKLLDLGILLDILFIQNCDIGYFYNFALISGKADRIVVITLIRRMSLDSEFLVLAVLTYFTI